MGLTKRKGTYYVEFRVVQERGHLTLAQIGQGTMKRWKVGSLNKECARNQEALIKTRLLAGTEKIASREKPILFEEWADRYLAMK